MVVLAGRDRFRYTKVMKTPRARLWVRMTFALFLSAAAVASVACLSPTQGRIVVYTDMPCTPVDAALGRDALTNFRVYVAKDRQSLKAKLESGTFDAEAGCSGEKRGRRLGDVVVAGAGEVYIAVQAGLWPLGGTPTPAADCKSRPEACVVARRVLQYQPHQELVIPIALDASCTRVRCGEEQTCSNGRCENIPTISEATPATPVPTEEPPVVVGDAGSDATTTDPPPDPMLDAASDGDIGEVILDAAMVSDAIAISPEAGVTPPTIPTTIARCAAGMASLSPYGTKSGTTPACVRSMNGLGPACVGPVGLMASPLPCQGTPDPPGNPAVPPIYEVCCALQVERPCCALKLSGGLRVPVYRNNPDPTLGPCATLQSARAERGTPCFVDATCESSACEFVILPDAPPIGYGFCK
jgi:hypothetical protein